MSKQLSKRSDIPEKYTWNAASVFPSVADWEAASAELVNQLANLDRFRGHLQEGPEVLLDWFATAEQIGRQLGRLYVYASLAYSVDTNDQAAAARNDQMRGLFGRAIAATAFAEPELLTIPNETLQAWMASTPDLAVYRHYFERLGERRDHVRSPEVEEVLGLVRDAFGTASATHGVLANTDLTFAPAVDEAGEQYEVGQGSISALLTHTDRKVRRTAWESYADAHLAYKNTMATALAAGIKQNVFNSRVRRYGSALEAALASSYVPVEVFHNLIATFQQNLPTWHRYWQIRRRALGYETLGVYDIKAPLTAVKPHVPYEQAVDWIAEGMAPLGEEYVRLLRRGSLEERWIDVYPNQGKRMGAFSSGSPGTHPFIMMSYTDDLFSLSTLAHELGHSLHSYYSWQTQPFVYSRYGLFAAEVASNFNQALVRAHLLAAHKEDVDFQIAVIEEAMSNFHRYFFIMPTLARFELAIHQRVERGQALTADDLIALLADLFAEGYGDEVEQDQARIGITWAQFHTHLYANFYVYQYATGISGAHALANRVLAGEPGAAGDYLGFLKAGGSLYPLEALKQAGVDLTTPEPVETTFGILAEMVDQLEDLIGQRTAVPA